MSNDDFVEFCSEHPHLFIESNADGELVVSPPPYNLTSVRNTQILRQLTAWAETSNGIVLGPASLFILPNGARRSPDAAWVSQDKISQLNPETLDRYWKLCPDFVIELKSKTDRISTLRAKMLEWVAEGVANGAKLASLIDPDTESVEIFRPAQDPEQQDPEQRDPEKLVQPQSLAGEGPVDGFVLKLDRVWRPLER
jgi:Uma2 family endonuclease